MFHFFVERFDPVMKERGILILIAIILAIHGLLLYIVMQQGAPKETRTVRTEESADPDESGKPEEAAADSVKKEEPEKRTSRPPLNLNWKKTAKGTIAALPGSKAVRAGILVDLDSGDVLWAKNENQPVPIASMSKIMTILLAYEAVLDSRNGISLDTKIPVTREAINTAPSKVGFYQGESFPLRDLLLAASIQSANDAAYLIAQHLGGGNADVFVRAMNQRAAELGMENTIFFNPHGLPGKNRDFDNKSSMTDLVRLCWEFMRHKELMEWAAIRRAPFRKQGEKGYVMMRNHNNLLPGAKYQAEGVTGIKTGFTNRAGCCVAASCVRDGRHLLAIIAGAPHAKDRDLFARALFDWGCKRIQK